MKVLEKGFYNHVGRDGGQKYEAWMGRQDFGNPESVIFQVMNKHIEEGGVGVGMVGRYFHTFNSDGSFNWQGRIVGRPEKGVYFVQLFDWLLGEASDKKLVLLKDMRDWSFYKTAEEMNDYYYRKNPDQAWVEIPLLQGN